MGKMGQVRFVRAALLLLPLLLTGCNGFFVDSTSNGGGNKTNTGDYVYVANVNPAEIVAYSVSSSGSLTQVGSPYTLNEVPTAMAITPNNGYLYVGGTLGLYIYTINSDGSLTLVSSAGASIPVASLAISPDGKYLFALQSNVVVSTNQTPTAYSVALDEYQIASGGGLVLMNNQSYVTNVGTFTPKTVRVSPNNGLVSLALGSAGTVVYQLSSGTLSTTANILNEQTVSADNDTAFDSNSAYLYIARSGSSSGVGAYAVSSAGALQQVGSTLAAAGTSPIWAVLDQTSKYLYVANQNSNSISAYTLSAGNLPAPISGAPFTAGTQPLALTTDNSGKYLFAINNGGSPDLQVYSYSSSTAGALSPVTSTATGTDPTVPIAIAATH